MRKLWIAALMTGLIWMAMIGVAAAQESPTPESAPNEGSPGGPAGGGAIQKRLENLSKQLNLTDEQKDKIGPLLRREGERIRDVRQNNSLTQGQAKRRIALIHRETNQHIAQVLTPEQNKQWQQMREERRAAHQGGQGRSGGPGGKQGSAEPDEPPANPPNPPPAQP